MTNSTNQTGDEPVFLMSHSRRPTRPLSATQSTQSRRISRNTSAPTTPSNRRRASNPTNRKTSLQDWINQYKSLKLKTRNIEATIKRDQALLTQDQISHEVSTLKNKIQSLNAKIMKLQNDIHSYKQNPPQNQEQKLNDIKELMDWIDRELNQFRESEKENLVRLNTEEKVLEREIDTFEERMKIWDREETTIPASKPKRQRKPLSARVPSVAQKSNVPQPVKDFEKFLATHGGRYGGWDEVDHQQFLKLRTQIPSMDLFFEQASKRIPGQTLFSIQQHEKWYKEFLEMKNKKKEAIEQWKQEKERERIQRIEQHEYQDSMLKKKEQEDESQQKRDEKLKEEKKKRIQAWKKEKEERELEKQREIEKLVEEERKSQQEKEEKRRLELHKRVEEYKKEREEQQREAILQTQIELKRPPSAQELQKLRERDELIARQRLDAKLKKQREEKEREDHLRLLTEAATCSLGVKVERDPTRLLDETAAQKSRIKELKSKGADNASIQHNFNIRHIQHRAMPSWRRR